MTTTAVSPGSSPQRRASERTTSPTAWRRLTRVAWLQHRAACFGFFGVLGVLAIAIVVEMSRASGAYASFVADGCPAQHLALSAACNADALALHGGVYLRTIGTALSILPLLVGVFLGAPLLSRELESGTFRFAWTQETSRTRLVLTVVVVLAFGSTAMAVFLGLLFGGWYAHIYEVVVASVDSQWQATLFATTWWMLAVWTLLGLAIGTLVGVLVRRTVAAMATTVAVLGALIAGAYLLLPRLLSVGDRTTRLASPVGTMAIGPINTPAQAGWPFGEGAWVVRSWLSGPHGHVLDVQAAQHVSYELSSRSRAGQERWLSAHHDSFWVSYQPPGHFWVVQGVEGLIVLVVAALCVALTLRSLRSRGAA